VLLLALEVGTRVMDCCLPVSTQWRCSCYTETNLGTRLHSPPINCRLRASDASFADNNLNRKSSQGYIMKIFGTPVACTWRANKQDAVTTSSMEVELHYTSSFTNSEEVNISVAESRQSGQSIEVQAVVRNVRLRTWLSYRLDLDVDDCTASALSIWFDSGPSRMAATPSFTIYFGRIIL
jgi:hypothetical protein